MIPIVLILGHTACLGLQQHLHPRDDRMAVQGEQERLWPRHCGTQRPKRTRPSDSGLSCLQVNCRISF